MKFLVTGASGFVGANLVREIASRDLQTVATTIGPPSPSALGFLAECGSLVKWVPADVRDKEQVLDVFRESDVDTILHGAAITSVSDGVSVGDMLATNVMGTVNVLEAARTLAIPRIVFLSSGAVYGHRAPYPQVVGECDPLRGDGHYAVSKIVGEQFFRDQAKEHDVSMAICRLGTLYGPMEIANPHRPRLSIPCQLMNVALRGSPIRVFGLARQRPYCYVADAARTVVNLALLPTLPTDTFNVGSPDRVALSDLLDVVSHLRPDFSFEEIEDYDDADVAMTADDERPVLDTAHVESLLGTVQWLKIEEGIERFMNWVQKSP